MMLLIFIVLNYFIAINAFNPGSITPSASATHDSITRCAVATVTSEYMKTRFGTTISIPTITNGICPSSVFSQIKDKISGLNTVGVNPFSLWEVTLVTIIAYNVAVDVKEQLDTQSHFDSESFIPASQLILQRYQSTVTALKSGNYDNANENFGKMIHTLQDFYSHSNWIELNNRQPHPDLGNKTMTAAQFAGPTVRTCTDCTTNVCQSNSDVTKNLTSGYFILLADIFKKKPKGKCSHGGSLDATRNNDASGGINKDTLDSVHGYLHQPAAQTAYLATCKILQKLRADVLDVAFGKFLNILNRKTTFSRSASLNELINSNLDPALIYTNILQNIRTIDSFSFIQQIASLPAIDSYYKAHILSIATHKHITIDIFRNSNFRQNSFDFGQDLARFTGGLYLYYYNKTQDNINLNRDEQTELIDLLYSKHTSNDISIIIDKTCSSILLEFITNDTIAPFTIQLRKSNQFNSPLYIVTNTTYYKSYLFSNLSSGNWTLIFPSSINFTFNLRILCSSKFRCFSSVFVNNDNPMHPGVVELDGNLIQNQNAYLITTCDNNNITITNMTVTMVDEINGNVIGNTSESTYDAKNDRWMTHLTKIPSKSFRLKFSINKQEIQRLSRNLYQSSLIDIEIIQVNTTLNNKTVIKYRLYNYYKKSIKMNFITKNIGTYMFVKEYRLKANETYDDQIKFDKKITMNHMTGNMFALIVSTPEGDWNYDIITF